METCLIVDGGNPARHAGGTGDISQRNNTGSSCHYWTELPQWLPLSYFRRLLESSPDLRITAVLKQLWLDLLAAERPRVIVNHNGAGYGHLGKVGRGWLSIHGTWPHTRRVEWWPFTGRNRPFGAAAHPQHQEHESRHPPVAK